MPPPTRRMSRFTPTGVGTIEGGAGVCNRWSVHPHGRGDNDAETWSSQATIGSPPRAWGQSGLGACSGLSLRFTPTGVGTIAALQGASIASTVHPHGRGDNPCRSIASKTAFGSPPRAWGQSLRLRHSTAIRLQKQASKSCSASGRYSYQKEPLYLYELTICGSATP